MSDNEIILEALRAQLKKEIPDKIGAPMDSVKIKRIRQAIECTQAKK